MPTIRFTATLVRHRAAPELSVEGATLREVIDRALSDDALLRSYVLDEQGRVRRHVNIFLDGRMVADKARLAEAVRPTSEIYVLQALSGG